MKKTTTKKGIGTSLALVLAFSFSTYSPKSEAILLVEDIANFIENVAGNIQQIRAWTEEQRMLIMGMDQEAMHEKMNVDNRNNAISNLIVRNARNAMDVQHKEVKEMSEPDTDACVTTAVQTIMDRVNERFKCDVHNKNQKEQKKHNNFNFTPREHELAAREDRNELLETCKSLLTGQPDNDEARLQMTMCTRAGVLTGTDSGTVLNNTEKDATDKFIELISGPTATFKRSNRLPEGSKEREAMLVEEMRQEAFRSLVIASLNEVQRWRVSPGTESNGAVIPSELEMLEKFNRDRFGSEEWIKSVQNSSLATKNTINTTQILRKMAVMDAFMVHMEVLKYKQGLRMETLQAALLAWNIDEPEVAR